jgi:hypothetical protein
MRCAALRCAGRDLLRRCHTAMLNAVGPLLAQLLALQKEEEERVRKQEAAERAKLEKQQKVWKGSARRRASGPSGRRRMFSG